MVSKRGISGFLKRVDRTLPINQSRVRRVVVDEDKPESQAAIKPPEPVEAPRERRSALAVIPLICAVLAMVALFAYTRTRVASSAANQPETSVVAPAATAVSAPPEAATPNPELAGEAASPAAADLAPVGSSPNLGVLDEKIVIGGADAKPAKKSAKKKPADPAPAPAVAEAPAAAAAPPAAAAAAPAAAAPAGDKKDSLQDQLKRQRDCLVSNRCDN